MAEKVNLQQKIIQYRQANPKLKNLSDSQILSIMAKKGLVEIPASQKNSILAKSKKGTNKDTGLKIEHKNTKKPAPKKTIYLQSGRKVVYSRLSDGRTVMQYFGADGTPIKPDYFKKVEGQISISADGNRYTVTKAGKKVTLKAKNPTKGAIDQNIVRLNNEEKMLNNAKKEQGFIGKSWDWIKNKTGWGDGSAKAQQQINAERKLLTQVKTGKISKKDFKKATGVEYTKENLEKFKRGELSQATAKINGYKEGQEMAADVVGDMVSGIAAVAIYTAAVAAAPLTGGASLAVGVAAAAASGAVIKAGVKALDTVGTNKKYTMKEFGHDLATGAFSGALAPITGGLGGAVGKTVATKLGIQAVKQVGKEVAEEVVETGVKQTLKTALTNPSGYEYVGGTLLKRGAAVAAEMATDGALGGAIDGGFRAGLDNNWDADAIIDGAVEGGIGGAIMSPVIGGGFKAAGKGAQKIFGKDNVKIDANGNKIAEEAPSAKPETTPAKAETNLSNSTNKEKLADTPMAETPDFGAQLNTEEEVAPFAERLLHSPSVEDLTNPEIKPVKLENGEFNVKGDFVSDGTYTNVESGNPFSKKSTFKRYSSGDKPLAQNLDELAKQYTGSPKPTKNDKKTVKRLIENHPELSIEEHSALLHEISILMDGRNGYDNFISAGKGLKNVANFKNFKTNLEEFNKFYQELKQNNASPDYVLLPLKNLRLDYISENMATIKPEEFRKNLAAFKDFGAEMQRGNLSRNSSWLFEIHSEKEFDNIKIASDYNKWAAAQQADGNENVAFLYREPFEFAKASDEEIAQIKQNIELVKEMTQNKSRLTNFMNDILESNGKTSRYTDLHAKLKSELGDNYDINDILKFNNLTNPDGTISEVVLHFAKTCPEEFKGQSAYDLYKLSRQFADMDKSAQENMLAKISILGKISSKFNRINADKFLAEDMPNAVKIKEFVENAEPKFLIKLSNVYSGGSKTLEEMFTNVNIEQYVKNAKLHKQLPKKLLDRLDDFSTELEYNVDPDILKLRVDMINKYQDKFSANELFSLYKGYLSPTEDVMTMLSELKPEMREALMASGFYGDNVFNSANKVVLSKFKNYINNSSITKKDCQDFYYRMEDMSLDVFGLLSDDELSSISLRSMSDLACSDNLTASFAGEPTIVDCIKANVALVPKRVRDLIKNDVSLNVYTHTPTPEKNAELSRVVNVLEKFSDDELQDMGGNVIAKFIEENVISNYGREFNSNNVTVWKQLDKDVKDKLRSDANSYSNSVYKFLFDKQNFNIDEINSKFAKLKSQGMLDEINSGALMSVLKNDSKEMQSVLDDIVTNPSFDKKNINYVIYNLEHLKNEKINDWDYVKDLLAKNIDVNDIGNVLSALADNADVRIAQKDFANYMLARADIDNKLIPSLLRSVSQTEWQRGNTRVPHHSNAIKMAYAKELFENPNINNEDVVSIIQLLHGVNVKDEVSVTKIKNFITKIIEDKKYTTSQLENLMPHLSDEHKVVDLEQIAFADNLLSKYNLDINAVKNIIERSVAKDDNPQMPSLIRELTYDLLNNENLPNEEVGRIVPNISHWRKNAKIQSDFAKELVDDETVPKDIIAGLISSTDYWGNNADINVQFVAQKIGFIKKLLKNNDIDKHYIANIVYHTPSKNMDVAKDLVFNLIKNKNVKNEYIYKLVDLLYSNNGIAPEVLAQKISDFASSGLDVPLISAICTNATKFSVFSDEVVAIIKRIKTDNPSIDIQTFIQNMTEDVIPQSLEKRIETLLSLTCLTSNDKLVLKNQGVDIDAKIRLLMQSIDNKRPIITTSKEDVKLFLNNIANNSKADGVIQKADFEKFGKEGIKLQYSRDEFIENMDKIVSEAGGVSKEVDTSNAKIPELVLSEADKNLTAEKIAELRANHKTEEVEVILDGEKVQGTRFLGTQGGSNKAYYTQIGDKLYYIKYPDNSKLGQSVEEVVAANLYRAAEIDSPNMKYIYDETGRIIGMAGEYVPNISMVPHSKEQVTDGFAVDAWLANWDAPKNDNTQFRTNGVIKVDVGGSLRYRARGEMKNFGNVVEELSTLIEQNSQFLNMTKGELLNSLKHVIEMPEDKIVKIIQDSPLDEVELQNTLLKRKEYMTIFADKLKTLDETKYNNILDMINAAKVETLKDFRDNANVAELLGYTRTKTGFEGLLNDHIPENVALSPEQKVLADKMIAEIDKFTKYNKVADDIQLEPETREFLNSILKGVPEFAAYFGKPQHNLQKYSLDIHILKVLQDSMNDPMYKELGDKDKLVLKFSTLLHDIGKRYLLEGSDTGHAAMSAEYVYSILDRFNLPSDVKDRIIINIENHHWFKAYNNRNLSPQFVAALCRRPEDFKIYQIMAKADLKNVNDTFYQKIMGASSLDEADLKFAQKMSEIAPYVQQLQEKQVVVTPSKFREIPERVASDGRVLERRGFPKETTTLNGVDTEFAVLNLSKMPLETNMFKYGFNNIQLNDLRLMVHMIEEKIDLDIFNTLARNPMNNSAQSLSMISMADKATYGGRRFGVAVDVENANVAYAYFSNANSGTQKGFSNFVHEMFEDSKYRSFVKDKFNEYMQTKGIELSEPEYAAIAKDIMNKQYPETQIKDVKVGDKVFSKDDVLGAFTFSRDQLIDVKKMKAHGSHDEIVGLNSHVKAVVAKVNSLKECPAWFLEFAKESNLPIILLGQ